MKINTCLLILFVLLFGQLSAQTLLLNIDGETPDPLSDKTGLNNVTQIGNMTAADGEVIFGTGTDYLKIDTFTSGFDINGDWNVELEVRISADCADDSIYFIDWRSNSSVGHMHLGYNANRGVLFSDRNINGLYGSLVADTTDIPVGVLHYIRLEKSGDTMRLYRGNPAVMVDDTILPSPLSEVSTTTIGYSEDFRYAHDTFSFGYIRMPGEIAPPDTTDTAGNGLLTQAFQNDIYLYPNPAIGFETVKTNYAGNILSAVAYDLQGRPVKCPIRQREISVAALVPGMYMIQIDTEDGLIQQKLLK